MAPSPDRYEPLEVTGSGGMATVWRARDNLLGRIVAMKRPHPAPPDSEVYARFERESRMAATVSHPNLVTVHDVGSDDIGPYLIMEFIDAPSLADTTVGPDRAAIIGSQIASGVAELHAVGVVHRDIKPANVLMAPGGAKLTDFGIARSLESVDTLTQAGVLHATPAYAAPEVLAGGDYSPEADVYSLGALLLELVTGEHATSRQGTRVMATDTGWARILGRAMSEAPDDRPSAADLSIQLKALSMESGTAVLPSTTRLPLADVLPATAVMTAASRSAVGSAPQTIARRRSEPARYRSRGVVRAFAVLAVVVLGVVAIVASRPLLDATSPTDAAPPGVVPPVTVAPQPVAPQPVATEVPPTEVARGAFVDFVQGLPQSEIKSKEVRELVATLDDAFSAVWAADTKRAIDKLNDVVKAIDKEITSDTNRDFALGLLLAVSDSLGIGREAILDD